MLSLCRSKPQPKPNAATPPAGNATNKPEGQGLTVADRRRMAMRPPSFTDLLPWTRFHPTDKVFTLNDGLSVAAMFELTPTPTEAMPDNLLRDRADKVLAALKGIPEEDPAEWIVQFFVSDDTNLDTLPQEFLEYIQRTHAKDPSLAASILSSEFTKAWVAELADHVETISRPGGLFNDDEVSGNVWRGQLRRVRCFLYRKVPASAPSQRDVHLSPAALLNAAADGLLAGLKEADVGARRCTGEDFYNWMLPFFNRQPGLRPSELLAKAPYPGDSSFGTNGAAGNAPIFGFDLASQLSLTCPRSDPEAGTWEFDGRFVRALTLQQLVKQPSIGHFTAERRHSDMLFAKFDRLPAGSMLSITVAIKGQHLMQAHVQAIQAASQAETAEAQLSYGECDRVLNHMATGDKLVPLFLTLYVSGGSQEELRKNVTAVTSQLSPSGFHFIRPGDDLMPLDAFIRGLPACFDPTFDLKHMRRTRLVFLSQIADMLPVYGRHRGTGNPGIWMYNRGGEPLWIDPLNKQDRKKNAHMLTLGPTGAGKSATLNYLCMQMMAIHRPRLVIVDAGKSFGLLVEYFKSKGLSTNVVLLNPQADVSLPPFVMANSVLDDPDVMSSFRAAERAGGAETGDVDDSLVTSPLAVDDEEAESADRRDVIGEMLISAIMMITGGEPKETDKLGRADRYLITRAIIRAAQTARAAGMPHPLSHDVAVELTEMRLDASISVGRRERAEEMGQAMLAFTQGLRGKLFNRHGSAWPDVDVTLVEMGTLVQDGYEDALALAYTGLIDHVQAIGEAHQNEGRHTIFLTDEGHVITTNPLLGPKIAKGTKMWRKLSIWFWLATQNVADFPDSMSRVLTMCEWWALLTLEPDEIEQISRFKSLTKEQRLMVESCRKSPGKYTEGVLLSSARNMLFRNVPPPLAIALAGTEGDEKADRRRLMQKHSCSELDAAILVARGISARQRSFSSDATTISASGRVTHA